MSRDIIRPQDILKVLHDEQRPLKAYEILALISAKRASKTVSPPTVYRALERLMKDGLVHRVESLNAFVVCKHDHHDHDHRAVVLAICQQCGQTKELEDANLLSAVEMSASRSRFVINRASVEIHGICNMCDLPVSRLPVSTGD